LTIVARSARKALARAIEAAEADAHGGKVLLRLEHARVLLAATEDPSIPSSEDAGDTPRPAGAIR
jgi:hypothetical protein